MNAVFGSLPVYYMSSTLLPKGVRELLDAKWHAFLRTSEEKCHGSNCPIAWECVCQNHEAGGLGVKNLEELNHCLLMKIFHKLHEPGQSPWKT